VTLYRFGGTLRRSSLLGCDAVSFRRDTMKTKSSGLWRCIVSEGHYEDAVFWVVALYRFGGTPWKCSLLGCDAVSFRRAHYFHLKGRRVSAGRNYRKQTVSYDCRSDSMCFIRFIAGLNFSNLKMEAKCSSELHSITDQRSVFFILLQCFPFMPPPIFVIYSTYFGTIKPRIRP
jgi:hypothetical protein